MRIGWIVFLGAVFAVSAATAEPLPACVGSGLTLPTRITPLDLSEEYPDLSAYQHEEGDVLVNFTVHDDGSVSDASVVSSSDFVRLDAASLIAVSALRYQPAMSEGKAVTCATSMRVQWILPKATKS